MRRVLLFITDLELGGTPIVVRELATRLRSHALEVEVACLKPAGVVGDQLRAHGIRVTSLEARRALGLPRAMMRLARLVRERQIDTVLSFLVHANAVAALASEWLPKVRWLQSIQTTQPTPRWHWRVQRWAARKAERIIVPSESIVRRAMEWSDVPREKLLVIPNAVDVAHFDDVRATRSALGGIASNNAPGPFRVGFVGRLDPIKRVDLLIVAFSQIEAPSTELHLFGDGPERSRLEQAAAASGHGSRIIFHGAVQDVREAYRPIDVLVLPSDAEGFGLVLIEAMASGVPVIGTDVDGIRDVIRDRETGVLVAPRDTTALASAIRRLRDDPALREGLIERAREDVEARFGWAPVLEAYRTLLHAAPR